MDYTKQSCYYFYINTTQIIKYMIDLRYTINVTIKLTVANDQFSVTAD